jgi:hypothetical protein
MVNARDAAVGAIVAAAGGLAVGLVKLTRSGWLASTAAFGLRGWQVLSVGAFAVNVVSVGIPGRVDGEMAEEAKRVRAATKKAAKADGKTDTHKDEPAGIPRAHWSRGLVSPAGWAFAIWGPIFIGEAAFTAAVAAPSLATSNPTAASVFAAVAPWWAGACGLQALWCVAFRPWAKNARHFWLSGALLAAEAATLGAAHRVMVSVSKTNPLSLGMYVCGHAPLAMHFGWITAAAVVSLNSFVAVRRVKTSTRVSLAFASTWLAASLGACVTSTSGDPIFALVLAWALSAVASDGGRSDVSDGDTSGVGDVTLSALSHSAATAAKGLTTIATFFVAKKIFF